MENLNNAQIVALICALRQLQNHGYPYEVEEELSDKEIDSLCEALNFDTTVEEQHNEVPDKVSFACSSCFNGGGDVTADFVGKTTQVLEISGSELDADVISILEGIIDLTPVDPSQFMWLVKMETLIDSLNDEGLEEGYDDAFKDKWEAFVKRCDTLNTISQSKYVMIMGGM